jgi:hypothetical protein
MRRKGFDPPGPDGGRSGTRSPWTLLYDVLRGIYWRFAVFPAAHVALLRRWTKPDTASWPFRTLRTTVGSVGHGGPPPGRGGRAHGRFAPEPDEWPELDISVSPTTAPAGWTAFFASLTAQRYPLDGSICTSWTRLHRRTPQAASGTFWPKRGLFSPGPGSWPRQHGFRRGHDRACATGGSRTPGRQRGSRILSDSLCTVVRAALADTGASWEAGSCANTLTSIPTLRPVTLETAWSPTPAPVAPQRLRAVRRLRPGPFQVRRGRGTVLPAAFHGYVLKYVPSAAVTHHAYEARARPSRPSTSRGLRQLFVRLRYGNSGTSWPA